jgi:N-acetyl-alpha-D-glucosaminyl L-malate synthase BshA
MHVGIICHPTFGGSGVVASELGMALADRGHQVHLFSYRRPFRIPASHANTHFHEVEVTTYPLFKYPPYTLALATKLAAVSRREPIDLLHAHYAIPHALSAYLCRQLLGSPSPRIITTLHGTDITLIGLDDSFYEITRFGILQSDGLTAVSEHLARETEARFAIDRPVRVIPNFVDTKRFSPERRSPALRQRFADEGEALVGHVSNFRSVKRVGDVVRVFHRLQARSPAKLLMVGDGPELEPARALVQELGLQEKVEFLGPRQDVPGLLAQLDLFLLPSEYESFGLAALEAMACGVPVIASRAGGLPEVVDDGSTGFLLPVGDVQAMARRAAEILDGDGLRRRLSAAARRRAEERFPLPKIVDAYEAYYREVLGA